jgi:hypothetical protein
MVEVAVTEHLPAGLRVNPNLLATFQAFWQEGYVALKLSPMLEQVSQEEVVAIQRGARNTLEGRNFLFVDVGRCQEVKDICLQALGRCCAPPRAHIS